MRPVGGGPGQLRLSRKADVDARTRLITSIDLPEAEFALLGQRLARPRLKTLRHRLHAASSVLLSIDELQGELEGLILARPSARRPKRSPPSPRRPSRCARSATSRRTRARGGSSTACRGDGRSAAARRRGAFRGRARRRAGPRARGGGAAHAAARRRGRPVHGRSGERPPRAVSIPGGRPARRGAGERAGGHRGVSGRGGGPGARRARAGARGGAARRDPGGDPHRPRLDAAVRARGAASSPRWAARCPTAPSSRASTASARDRRALGAVRWTAAHRGPLVARRRRSFVVAGRGAGDSPARRPDGAGAARVDAARALIAAGPVVARQVCVGLERRGRVLQERPGGSRQEG